MAAVSQMTTTLTSSPFVWEDARPTETEAPPHGDKTQIANGDFHTLDRPPLAFQNGNSTLRGAMSSDPASRRYSSEGLEPVQKANGFEITLNDSKDCKTQSIKDHPNSDNVLEVQGRLSGERGEGTLKRAPGDRYPDSDNDENSKWIHKMNGSGRSITGSEQTAPRSRKNSTATSTETRTLELTTIPTWDLRRPQEILEEGSGHGANNGGKASSRIPVAKISGVPIPSEHLARDTRIPRKRDNSPGVEDSITYPKPRARSGSTGNALAKATTIAPTSQTNKRPDSSPKKPPNNGGNPKTKAGQRGRWTTEDARRAEQGFDEQRDWDHAAINEGEPPWMISAYRPDPRLPPDQQLLPTVAKRLQQEKWEREGKFGSIYDKEFRPLTDEGFLKPPETAASPDKEAEDEAEKEEQKDGQGEWPLKAEPKSPTIPGRTNSYSTMPKISEPPANPLPTTRAPSRQAKPSATVRVPEPPEEPAEKKGCGCCIVM
ncbi:hypothetical protein N0V88_002205 [Collariella sp. IMI 366227]|nr:hypothetical protein N0V88_002205 [Collariella sp. IMI 366227]